MDTNSVAEKTKKLRKDITPYAHSDSKKSYIQLANTIVPLLALWILSFWAYNQSLIVSVTLSLIASGFVIRTFIIFHDCTHGSFFKSKKANNTVGFITGVITTFPYEKWKREHTIHHASSGNLDKRGVGDIHMMTIPEYLDSTPREKFLYRLYRNPLVMFLLGPLFLLFYANRFNRKDAKPKEKRNTYLTTFCIFGSYALLIFLFGWVKFLVVIGISVYVAAMLGIWLFYIQHTYEESYFEYDSEWDYVKAAIEGSSFYKLPKLLQWITGNIGFHHVHHLSPRVPNYNLEKAHSDIEPLQKAQTITLLDSIHCLRFKLYDEENNKFISFKELEEQLIRIQD